MNDSSPDTKKPRNTQLTPRRKRWGIIAIALVAAYTLFGFFAVPALIKSIATEQISKLVQESRNATIQEVRFNPYTLRLEVDGLRITQADSDKTFVGLDGLRADVSAPSLLALRIRFEEATFVAPEINVSRLRDGSFSFSDIIDKLAAAPQDAAATEAVNGDIFPVVINNFNITSGNFSFRDKAASVNVDIADLNLSVPFTSTREDDQRQYVEPFVNATVNDAKVQAKGKTLPFDDSLQTRFDITLADLDVTHYAGYIPLPKGVQVDSGILGVNLALTFNQRSRGLPDVGLRGGITASDLALSESGRPLAQIASVNGDIKRFSLTESILELNDLTVESPECTIATDKQGRLNWMALAPGSNTAPSDAPKNAEKDHSNEQDAAAEESAPSTAPPFTVRVTKADINNGVMNYSQQKGVQFEKRIAPINITLENMDTSGGAAGYDIAIGPKDGERINASGYFDIAQRSANGTLQIANVQATDYEPFYRKLLPVRLKALTLGCTVPFTAAFNDAAAASVANASVTLSALRLRNPDDKGATTRLRSLTASGINADVIKLTGTVDAVTLQKLTLAIPGKKGRIAALPALKVSDIEFDGTTPSATIRMASLSDVSVQPPGKAEQAFTLDQFTVADVAYDGGQSRLSIKKAAIRKPSVLAALDADGILNIQRILSAATGQPLPKPEAKKDNQEQAEEQQSKQTTEQKTEPKPQPPSFIASVGEITVDDGSARFTDQSVNPVYATELSGITVRVNGLSNEPGSRASLNVSATLDGQAPFEIKGAAAPNNVGLNPNAVLTLNNMDLTALSPYTLKYVSHPLSTGKLSLDLRLNVQDRELTGENLISFSNVQLGEKQKSPDDAGVPIGLALALLTDRSGNGNLDVPLRGNLDDPEFRLGRVIFGAIMNMIYKVVTSPFALIGSVFGGGEDLDNIAMPAGRAELNIDGAKKLNAVGKALTERPRLQIEIRGLTDKDKDTAALTERALERAIATPLFLELQEEGKAPATVDDIRLTPVEYPDYLFKAYSQAFGTPAEDMTPTGMEDALRTLHTPTPQDLRELARNRAALIRDRLIKQGIAPERIFLKEPEQGSDKSGVHMTLQ